MMNDPRKIVGLADILSGTSVVISDLKKTITPIEDALGEYISDGSHARKIRKELQDIDLLFQLVDAISKFLEQVSQSIPTDVRIDPTLALADIKLEFLRQQLTSKIWEEVTPVKNSLGLEKSSHQSVLKRQGKSIELF